MFEAPAATDLHEANWALVRALVARLGDGWDIDESEYELLCECGRPGCRHSVLVTLVEYVEARSKGYAVVVPHHEHALDLVVRRADGYRVVARARGTLANRSAPDRALVGDWTCGCGQEYRAASRGSRLLLWPRNSAVGFRAEPIGDRCVRGCDIDEIGVVRTLVGRVAQTADSLDARAARRDVEDDEDRGGEVRRKAGDDRLSASTPRQA